MRGARSLAIVLILAVLVPTAVVIAIAAGPAVPGSVIPAVWFSPAEASPDLTELFTRPDAWTKARSEIGVFLFSPTNVDAPRPGQANPLTDLIKVDAFRKLKQWGIAIGIGAPAIKEWDCTGEKAAAVTERMIANVAGAGGGAVQIVTLDEPLVSALGHNKPICHLSVEEGATIMARYAARLRASTAVRSQGQMPLLFEDEAYPNLSVAQLTGWVSAEIAKGFPLAGLALDVDLDYVERSVQRRAALLPDLREIQRFLSHAGIAFGVILWPGHDPLRTDLAYYNDVIDWTRQVYEAVGRPDYVNFASWVTRCSAKGPCQPGLPACSDEDPPYCGRKSIPLNLPEFGADSYAHTKLIEDAVSIFH